MFWLDSTPKPALPNPVFTACRRQSRSLPFVARYPSLRGPLPPSMQRNKDNVCQYVCECRMRGKCVRMSARDARTQPRACPAGTSVLATRDRYFRPPVISAGHRSRPSRSR